MPNPKNKWSQPAAPPPPMFFGKKERDLVKQVNDELAERVIGQPIAYYPISIEESNFSEIYGEAIEKVALPPIRVYAYVVVENEQTTDRYGYEYQTKLTVNFNSKRLTADQDLFVRVGDFVQYGTQLYEIVKTYNDTRYYFGQVQHRFQISAECIRARQDAFRVVPELTRPTTPTVQEEGGPNAAPRAAPYPPLDASYVVIAANPKLPSERVLTAGGGVTITDGGANGAVTIAASGQNAVGPTGSLQFQTGAGVFSGSVSLGFLTSSSTLLLTGSLSASADISASAFYGDGSNLTGISTTSTDGIFTTINGSNAYVTSSLNIGGTSTPGAQLQVSSSGDQNLFQVDGATNGSILFVTGSGRVGIGTTSPGKELTVVGEISASSAIYGTDLVLKTSAADNIASIYIEGTSGTEIIGLSGGNMDIRSDGGSLNLLGGTGYELHFGTDRIDSRMVMDTNGKLGIGTDTPTHTLTVAGDVSSSGDTRIGGDLYVQGTLIGSSPLKISGSIDIVDIAGTIVASVGSSSLGPDVVSSSLGVMTTLSASGLTTTQDLGVSGSATFAGAMIFNRTAITNDYSVALTDYYLGVDTTSNTVDLTLPAASTATEGQTFAIKDEGGNTDTNVITIVRSASDTIDGATSATIESPYGALSLYTDGSDWFIY